MKSVEKRHKSISNNSFNNSFIECNHGRTQAQSKELETVKRVSSKDTITIMVIKMITLERTEQNFGDNRMGRKDTFVRAFS